MTRGWRSTASRQRSERLARRAETLACVILVMKGYRVLDRRARTPFGEIDIIAVRGRRLACVEVKLRPTLELCARSVTPRQVQRITDASYHWAKRHRRYARHNIGLDRVDVAGWFRFRHVPDGLADHR